MADEFERWMREVFSLDGGEVRFYALIPPWNDVEHSASTSLTPEQVRRLIAFLHRLSGHAPGPLPAGELEAIRARAEAALALDAVPTLVASRDRAALLRALDSALADLAAAEGEVDGLNHVVACMKNDRLAYQIGVGDERARCVEWLTGRASGLRSLVEQAPRMSDAARELHVARVVALEDAALALESPAAPAAAPKEE